MPCAPRWLSPGRRSWPPPRRPCEPCAATGSPRTGTGPGWRRWRYGCCAGSPHRSPRLRPPSRTRAPGGGPRVGVLAALPTVTEVSRASLFAGRIAVGSRAEERAVLAAAMGSDALLLHKAELRAGSGASLEPSVIAALADPSVRLVA